MINVIYALFFRELKTRFGKNRRLGYALVVAEPMIQVVVITSVITAIREHSRTIIMPQGISVFMFLAVGIIPFFMFRNILTQLIGGIQANLGLFAYKPVKPIHVFITRTLLESFIFFFVILIVLFLAQWVFGIYAIPKHFLEVYLCFVLLAFSGFCLGLCLTILNHLVEPSRKILPYTGIILYILSAIVYPIWIVPQSILDVLLYNPYIHITETLKMNYFENYPVTQGIDITYPILFNLVLLFIGLWFYYYKRQELAADPL